MSTLIKLLVGVVLLVVPLGMYAYELMSGMEGVFGLRLIESLGILLQGIVPPLVMLVGLFVIWLELDEWRIEKELKKEEEKEKKVTKEETATKKETKSTKKVKKRKK